MFGGAAALPIIDLARIDKPFLGRGVVRDGDIATGHFGGRPFGADKVARRLTGPTAQGGVKRWTPYGVDHVVRPDREFDRQVGIKGKATQRIDGISAYNGGFERGCRLAGETGKRDIGIALVDHEIAAPQFIQNDLVQHVTDRDEVNFQTFAAQDFDHLLDQRRAFDGGQRRRVQDAVRTVIVLG